MHPIVSEMQARSVMEERLREAARHRRVVRHTRRGPRHRGAVALLEGLLTARRGGAGAVTAGSPPC